MIDLRPISILVPVAGFCCCSVGAPAPVEPIDEVREALIRDLRIGFVRPSGDIVWPVETLEESAWRFSPPHLASGMNTPAFKKRESMRRRWGRWEPEWGRWWKPELPSDPEPVVEGSPRLRIGATVAVLHDGGRFEAIVEGFTFLIAGCGQAAPGWRARTVVVHEAQNVDEDGDGSNDPALWRSTHSWQSTHSHMLFPVLIGLDGAPFQPPITAVDEDLPGDLLVALAERDLLEGERRSLRTGRLWTVYGARTIDAHGRKVGSLRSTWRESKNQYSRLMAEDTTNPSYEEMVIKWHQEHHAYTFDSAVGQVHAKFEHGGRVFFLSRYIGWESDKFLLEEVRPGGLDPVLLDGLDHGC